MARPSYAVVTPARDEAPYLPDLAEALFAQTLPFARWVIVDDGSTDGTRQIAEALARRDHRVSVVRRGGGGQRVAGFGDLVAFNAGLDALPDRDCYDFLGKMDADIVPQPDYYERLLRRFGQRPRLGIAGGHCFNRFRGRLVLDRVPDAERTPVRQAATVPERRDSLLGHTRITVTRLQGRLA
jgi:glycosyltransferase involved in cell wall biosynthesis